ncbi:hypothetical protein SLEP1_g38026 [Rubroshorea leprosula]|uniref:Pentatricopeptide repeat-containing protein n=1 Tax=Rubroshorea leprosula TaxID=152421 RepID=A0AAV5KWV5_9ROSI|nr:hypothetical protein SLEP1_g38026 [Rubroshorea leprosula]
MLDAKALPYGEHVGYLRSRLCKLDSARDAYAVYVVAKEKNTYTAQSYVKLLVTSLCKKDRTVNLALKVLGDFSGVARMYAIKPFSAIIRSLCRVRVVDEAATLLVQMISQGLPPENAHFNSIIFGYYSKARCMKRAEKVIEFIKTGELKPDVYASVVISGCANGGQMDMRLAKCYQKPTKSTLS